MSKINIKIMSDDGILFVKKNIDAIANRIINESTNSWVPSFFNCVSYVFKEKKITINDFSLKKNINSDDKQIDFENSIILYENLKDIPKYLLFSEGFWLWLYFDKFYVEVREFMIIKGRSTIKDHWLFSGGVRRGLFFGVLSRMFLRVYLTVDDSSEQKYELTQWVIENPERLRNLTWRSFSSEKHLVKGIIRAEKKFCENNIEKNSLYPALAKAISMLGSVKILDSISEKDIENYTYNQMIQLSKKG